MSVFPSQQPPGRRTRTLIIEDDDECEGDSEGDPNPFSFKEFVRSKTGSGSVLRNGDVSKDTGVSATLHPEPCQEVPHPQDTFFRDPTADNDLLDDNDEDWRDSYHPSAIEQTLDAASYPDVSYRYSDASVAEHFTRWRLSGGGVSPEAGEGLSRSEDFRFQSLQSSYEEVLEENSSLKMRVQELKTLHESQAEKVRGLERRLEERFLEEQKEAQDLESMVQQVERNLQLMTKRASKAESAVTRLRQEVTLLQIQLNTYKGENEALRRGETAGMNAVKQNANMALENLHKAVSGAQASIKQLVTGAESLNLVAELLRSIDKIAEVHEDVP